MLSPEIRLLLAALACYRLTRLLVYDVGPWEVLHRLRVRAGSGELGKALACAHCTGLWVAIVATLLVLVPTAVGDVSLVWLGIAGAVSLAANTSGEG